MRLDRVAASDRKKGSEQRRVGAVNMQETCTTQAIVATLLKVVVDIRSG
jgi:hypothetical protein